MQARKGLKSWRAVQTTEEAISTSKTKLDSLQAELHAAKSAVESAAAAAEEVDEEAAGEEAQAE